MCDIQAACCEVINSYSETLTFRLILQRLANWWIFPTHQHWQLKLPPPFEHSLGIKMENILGNE